MNEIFDAGKEIGQALLKPIVKSPLKKWTKYWEDREILRSFSKDFVKHPKHETYTLDYYTWHEKDTDIKVGSGHIYSVSYKEVQKLWIEYPLFSIYESFLLRHINSGGKVSRIFIAGEEIVNPVIRRNFLKVLFRHLILNFNPVVASITDLNSIRNELEVDCDMFGTFNDLTAYFFKFPLNAYPQFVRTSNKKFINRTYNCHKKLMNNSFSYEEWIRKIPDQLTSSEKKEVETVAEYIRIISKRKNDNV